jgi:hypothetical protein
MTPSLPHKPYEAAAKPGRWYRWRGYTVRWLLFGLVVSVFQPIEDDVGKLWLHKLTQALVGLMFGAACAVVFTLSENTFNTPRVQWKSWFLVVATWLVVKVTFVSVMAAAGG